MFILFRFSNAAVIFVNYPQTVADDIFTQRINTIYERMDNVVMVSDTIGYADDTSLTEMRQRNDRLVLYLFTENIITITYQDVC